MSAVKSQGTGLERQFQTALNDKVRQGIEWHPVDVYGHPDAIHREAKIAVFVDSCFWHGCPIHLRMPNANRDYWTTKIERNRKRDRQVKRTLTSGGWWVLRIWEHSVKSERMRAWWLTRISNLISERTK